MRTPGRCTNLEGCWISASHRDVWVSVGEDFVCPNCGGMMSPPPARARSFRTAKRVASVGAAAMMGLAAVTVGAVKLSHVSWTGRSAPPIIAQVPESERSASVSTKPNAPMQVAEDTERQRPDIYSPEQAALEVAKHKPSSPWAMMLGTSASTASARAASQARSQVYATPTGLGAAAAPPNVHPLVIYTAPASTPAVTTGQAPRVTVIAQAWLTPGASIQRPVELPISMGQPPGPETDAEPVNPQWHHHGIVKAHSGFLPGPAAASAPVRSTSVDAIAQICRIPSLLR